MPVTASPRRRNMRLLSFFFNFYIHYFSCFSESSNHALLILRNYTRCHHVTFELGERGGCPSGTMRWPHGGLSCLEDPAGRRQAFVTVMVMLVLAVKAVATDICGSLSLYREVTGETRLAIPGRLPGYCGSVLVCLVSAPNTLPSSVLLHPRCCRG